MKQRTRTREAPGRRRYAAGDAVKFRIVLDHKPHLKEVRLAFVHEADKRAVVMGKVEPLLRSEISAGGSRRSILEAEVTIPSGRPSGSTGSTGSATRQPEVGWDTFPLERAYPKHCN